jgi:hypothetical protein
MVSSLPSCHPSHSLPSFSPIPIPGLLWQIAKIQLPLPQIFVKNRPELVVLLQQAEDMISLLLLGWFNNYLTRSGTTRLVNDLKVSFPFSLLSSDPSPSLSDRIRNVLPFF